MAVVKVDFSGIESYIKCEEGEHIAVLKEAELKTSEAGNDMIACVFEVVAGASSGARVFDNFVLTEKALWRLKTYLECIGIKADGKLKLDLDKMTGKKCIIEVSHEEYKGQTRARISSFKKLADSIPASSDSEAPADNEGDDDWDEA